MLSTFFVRYSPTTSETLVTSPIEPSSSSSLFASARTSLVGAFPSNVFQAGIQDESMRDHRAPHTGRGVKGLHCRHHRRFRDHRDSTFGLPARLCACSLCQLSVRKTGQQKSTSTRSAGCEPAPPMKTGFSRASQAVSCREVSQSRRLKHVKLGSPFVDFGRCFLVRAIGMSRFNFHEVRNVTQRNT